MGGRYRWRRAKFKKDVEDLPGTSKEHLLFKIIGQYGYALIELAILEAESMRPGVKYNADVLREYERNYDTSGRVLALLKVKDLLENISPDFLQAI